MEPRSVSPATGENEHLNLPRHSIGKSETLSLRVSAACLTLFLLEQGNEGEPLVLFERIVRAQSDGSYRASLQPIGGGVQIKNLGEFEKIAGGFSFESEAAWAEGDLRGYIEPSRWDGVRDRLRSELRMVNSQIVETSPLREIQEEIGETIGRMILERDLSIVRVGDEVQSEPRRSARTQELTVRVFSVDEVRVVNSDLTEAILSFCRLTTMDMEERRARENGSRKATSLAVFPLAEVLQKTRENDDRLQEYTLADNVYAIVKHLPSRPTHN